MRNRKRWMWMIGGMLFLAGLAGCQNQELHGNNPVQEETALTVETDETFEGKESTKIYTLVSEETDLPLPTLTLDQEEGTFSFSYDVLSSYLAVGTYETNGDKVELTTEDGKFHYTFYSADEDTLRFSADESSDVQLTDNRIGAVITDGTVFSAEGKTNEAETGETEETAASPESTQTEPETSGAETGGSKEERIIVEPAENSQEPEGMTLYTSLPFFCGEDEWELCMYVTEGMVIDGELALDDLCRFQIRAVSGEKVYILFDEQVQLGVPASDVWTDTDNQLHIVIRDVRTARYRITDYVYNQENQQFEGRFVMDYDGINYWGEI